MRKLITLITTAILISSICSAQYVNIPDAGFRNFLQEHYPGCLNASGQLDTTCSTILNETQLDLSSPITGPCLYADLSGIQYFKNLRYLICANNNCLDLSTTTLPVTVDTLFCAYIAAGLSSFPPGLLILDCRSNGYTQLPAFPPTMKYIRCGENQVNTLPQLPAQLEQLDCANCLLTSLPALPSSLVKLDCSYNSLQSLPALPNSLNSLACYTNQLQSLPDLASTQVFELYAGDNRLTVLPELPATLQEILIAGNQLSSLPPLPAHLNSLGLYNNRITSLPALPSSLSSLDCSYNLLTQLPGFPSSLIRINIEFNFLNCIPKIPENCRDLSIDYRISCLPNRPVLMTISKYDENGDRIWEGEQTPLCNPVNNINQCKSFPVMTGTVYMDMNNNGIKDANEYSRKNCIVRLNANKYTFTNNNGNFEINADSTGEATLAVETPAFFTAVPANAVFTFNRYDTLVQRDFALQANSSVDSIVVSVAPFTWAARPGFAFPYLISYENTGTTTLTPAIVFKYDNSRLIYDSSSVAAVVNNGNNLSFSAGSLVPGEQESFIAWFTLKPTAVIGDTLSASGVISTGSYTIATDNIVVIRGSFDPNDKQATPQLSPSQVAAGKYVDYTIRFQNTGIDTAFNIVISDTLDNNLQANTLQMVAASHTCKTTVKNNIVFFEFLNILLPDSNVNEPGSHGFVSFRIKPQSTVAVNTIIPNKAAIYFDYNAPVITNTTGTLIKDFTVVPLRLVSFSAVPQTDNTTTLYWNTANEINTKQFVIEQSSDGSKFNRLSNITAKGKANNNYSANVMDINNSLVYYRLKIIDNDGSLSYSPVIKIDRRKNTSGIIVMINPVKDFIIISTNDRSLNNTPCSIINTQGSVVKNLIVKQGSQTVAIKDLPAGIYYIRSITGSQKILVK